MFSTRFGIFYVLYLLLLFLGFRFPTSRIHFSSVLLNLWWHFHLAEETCSFLHAVFLCKGSQPLHQKIVLLFLKFMITDQIKLLLTFCTYKHLELCKKAAAVYVKRHGAVVSEVLEYLSHIGVQPSLVHTYRTHQQDHIELHSDSCMCFCTAGHTSLLDMLEKQNKTKQKVTKRQTCIFFSSIIKPMGMFSVCPF